MYPLLRLLRHLQFVPIYIVKFLFRKIKLSVIATKLTILQINILFNIDFFLRDSKNIGLVCRAFELTGTH